MTDSHNSIVLSHANEEKFSKLFAYFAKSEPNAMRFSQFMQFLLDRCLITNKTTIKNYYDLFNEATHKRISKEPPPPNNIVFEKVIKKEELIFLFNELGKFMYHNIKGQQDKIYNQLLGEKVVAEKDSVHLSRVMVFDEINRKMFLENAVSTLSAYEDELKSLYIIYVDENYWSMKKHGRVLLSEREIQLQNKTMSSIAFLRFLKAADIIPHLINVEQLEDILGRVVPPGSPKESEFYSRHYLIDVYSKNLENPDIKYQGDPGLLLFEFMVTLGRIAVETSKQTENSKKVYDYVVGKFLKEYLQIRTNEEVQQKVQISKGKKSYLAKLEEYQKIKEDEFGGGFKYEKQEMPNPFQVLREKQAIIEGLKPIDFDVPAMLRVLQNQIPALPEKILVEQQLPPPYPSKFKNIEKIAIGLQPPPAEKKDKNKDVKVGIKKQPKKGEKQMKKYAFKNEEDQTKKKQVSQNHFQKLSTDLDYSLKPLASLDRGSIPLDPFPSIISEVLYPTEFPESVLPYIEAGLNAHNENIYALAIQNFQKAHEIWKNEEGQAELKASLELYFEFTIAGIYQSTGRDDYAFNAFYNCRNYAEKLPFLSPDRALPYCGMGEVLYNAEEYEMATRCFLKAREIRQKLLSMESIDTATVLNNLGCCFFMLDRTKQALGYFKIAHSVLSSELGNFHERTQAARQNITICNKGFYENIPEYRKMWEVYEKDPFGKAKKKKKKK